MKNILMYIFILTLLLVFSGCTGGGFFGGGSTPIGPTSDDDIGDGLEVRMSSINTRDLNRIETIYFTLTLRNSNFDPIQLDRNNIRIRTSPSDSSIQHGTIFEPESIEEFYDSLLFERGSIFISQNRDFSQDFAFTIHPDHTRRDSDLLNSRVQVSLEIDYEDEFEYTSSLRVDFQRNTIRSNTLTKRGPFDLRNFEVRSSNRGTVLQFIINAQVGSTSSVRFFSPRTQLGNSQLDCSYVDSDGLNVHENLQNNLLTSSNSQISVVCTIPQNIVSQFDDETTFTFSTEMDFRHEITVSNSFQMPRLFENSFN